MVRIYKKTKNFLLYTMVFGAALSVSSFIANIFTTHSVTRGRVSSFPIPFTPIASADVPDSSSGTDSSDEGGCP